MTCKRYKGWFFFLSGHLTAKFVFHFYLSNVDHLSHIEEIYFFFILKSQWQVNQRIVSKRKWLMIHTYIHSIQENEKRKFSFSSLSFLFILLFTNRTKRNCDSFEGFFIRSSSIVYSKWQSIIQITRSIGILARLFSGYSLPLILFNLRHVPSTFLSLLFPIPIHWSIYWIE